MAINKELIKESIRNIIIALGDDPDRAGLLETPDRVARMYEEVFEGMNYSNAEIADMFNKTFDEDYYDENSQDLVFVKDIEVFSYCEHHLALMYDMKVSVAYIPNGKVIGLSKIARIADIRSLIKRMAFLFYKVRTNLHTLSTHRTISVSVKAPMIISARTITEKNLVTVSPILTWIVAS